MDRQQVKNMLTRRRFKNANTKPNASQIINFCSTTKSRKKILKNLKTKLGNYCNLCTDQKNSQNNSIKVWLTLSKNGNNLYEH